MKILFIGTKTVFHELSVENSGQYWDMIYHEPDHGIVDYKSCHSFQSVILELGSSPLEQKRIGVALKSALDVPVTIGLSSSEFDITELEALPSWLDVILANVGSPKLVKSQCDAFIRLGCKLQGEKLVSGDVTLHIRKQTVSVDGRSVMLARRHYQLLELLFINKGGLVTTEMFFNHVYGWQDPPGPKIFDVLICGLRRKLREGGSKSECIETRWGQGYAIKTRSAHSNHTINARPEYNKPLVQSATSRA